MYLRSGVDVADVSCDAGSSGDIVEGKVGDEWVELHEEGEGLADAAGGSEDGDLALGDGLSRVAAAGDSLDGSDQGHGRPHIFFFLALFCVGRIEESMS